MDELVRVWPAESAHVTLPPSTSPTSNPTAPPLTPATTPPSPPISFPLTWLMEHGSAPIKYRALVDVAKLPGSVSGLAASLPFTYRPALTLAVTQHADGTWGSSMLTVPSARAAHFEDVGTINAVRRLLEYGWDRETPPVLRARRVLFRLLAEDDDPDFLFEFGGRDVDEDLARRARGLLREAAAATLAQAGYEEDPRLRGAARRILGRVTAYLRSPLAQKPFIRHGSQYVLTAEAAPPSVYALLMLAHMPHFRHEHHEAMALLNNHLTQPLPRHDALQMCGKHVIAQPHLVLGDQLPTRSVADADVAFALAWLELMARLGFLRKNDTWSRLFDRFRDDCNADGVWRPRKGMNVAPSARAFVWATYPLAEHASREARRTDVTFRLGLIGRLMGRTIDVV